MANITLAVPEEDYQRMKRYQDISWSAVARMAIQAKLELLEEMDRLAAKSTLTKADVMALSQKVNASMTRRLESS